MSQVGGWIGVDLDGTLAVYDGWRGPEHIGPPVALMVERVKLWISQGARVKIFTARISHDGSTHRMAEACVAHSAIVGWCREYVGQELEITNVKDYGMIELWDDRAVQVEANTGRKIGESTRGL